MTGTSRRFQNLVKILPSKYPLGFNGVLKISFDVLGGPLFRLGVFGERSPALSTKSA